MSMSATQILDNYFNHDKLVEVKLRNGKTRVGKLVSFFEGDEDEIVAWHFVDKSEIEKYEETVVIDGGSRYGEKILQHEIESVKFC